MTGHDFEEHLTHFQMTHTGAALYFKVARRTIIRWGDGTAEIPRAVELVLRCARALELSLKDFAKLGEKPV